MEADQSLSIKKENVLDRVFLYTAVALFGLTLLLTTVQVLVRQIPFLGFIDANWTVPVARFTLIIMTYIGGAVATRNREHISIDLVLDWVGKFYPRLRIGLNIISDLIVIAFLTIAVYGTMLSTSGNWNTSVGAVSGITSGYIYLGIGVGLLGMLIYELQHIYDTIVQMQNKDTKPDSQQEGIEDV
ncbi:TRAP transporter small permease [Halobellus limi]|uniref:TRAP transporter small permease n=1 Tax=Halobellus limi TaxID=699433 RepID=A0A1H6BNJ9_9EURY|nr:TRAP transporter small permease subunit [Halobellus limi]QCC49412.1 TRAP transporter small permease [Halobellus limi]SEG62261.1 TRAP-type C4-dicarboxylate transport system, small permease component [Halobellus limi]